MDISKTPHFNQVANTRKSEAGRWTTAAALVALLSTFVVFEADAQVIFTENFSTDTLKDAQTTADWDTTATALSLPTTGSASPIQSLTGSFLPAALSTSVEALITAETRGVAVGDLNGDGFLDLAFGNNGRNTVYFNDGFGVVTFSPGGTMPDDYSGGSNTRSVAIADFNGDGHLDVIFAEFGGQATRIHFNNGGGTNQIFTAGEFTDLGDPTFGGDSVVTGDVDNDNDIDVVLGIDNGHVKLLRNDGFGNFSAAEDILDTDPAFGFHARTVLLGDLDGDGDLDIVAAREEDPTRIYLNDGSGVFGTAQSAGLGVANSLPAPDSVALGDANGDGLLDLIVGNDGSGTVLGSAIPNHLFLNSGNPANVFPAVDVTFADMANTNGVGFVDIDQDGDLDIVTADFVSGNGANVPGSNRLYLNDGTGGFPVNGTVITADITASKSLASGDFDGDGDLDLVFANDLPVADADNRIVENVGIPSGMNEDQLYATGLSLQVGAGANLSLGVVLAPLTGTTDVEANRVFQYWLSDDGGLNWIVAHPNRSVSFPAPVGNNLIWRVEFKSPSSQLRPDLGQLRMTRDIAPGFTSAEVTAAVQDVEYTYNITTNDPDGANDLLDITASVLPAWLTLTDNGDTTATLIGTPTNADVGTAGNDVTLEVVDGAGRLASQTFVIDVGDVNDPPTVPFPTADQVFDQGDSVNLDTSLAFDDPDLDVLTYSATGLPPSGSLTIDNVTGIITGTLTNDDVFDVAGGVHTVVVTADDGNLGTVDDSFDLTVNNVNDAPTVVLPTGDQVIDQGTSVNIDASLAFEDIDGDTLTYSATGLPVSLTIDTNTGVVTGVLTNDDVLAGPDYAVVVTATEVGTPDLFSVDESLTLTVNNINDAPTVVVPTGNQMFDQGDSVNVDTSMAFDDIDGDTLTYSATGLPASLTLDGGTGIVTGTLTNDDALASPYAVVVTADDGNLGTVDDSFDLTVNNVNDAPTVVLPTGDQVIDQGTSVNIDASLAFEDIDGDTLTYSATGLPVSLMIDTNTGVVTGVLTNDDVLAGPDYAVVVTATEVGTPDLFSVDESLTLTVNDINDAPTVVVPTGNQMFGQGDSVNLDTSLAFGDVDGDTLTYSATGLPASLNLDGGTGIVTGTLTNDDALASPYAVVITADDGNTGTVDDNFSITVGNTNDAPTFTSTPLVAATEATAYSYSIVTADIDGDNVVVSAGMLPGWLTFDASGAPGTAELSGTPTGPDVGQVNVTLTANDGTAQVEQSFSITVVAAAEAPVITITGNTSVTVDQDTLYTDEGATALDAQDGDLTAVIVTDNPVDTSTVGTYFVTYSVTDSAGNLAQAQRTVDVVDTMAPVITLNGAATVTLTVGDVYNDQGATATDNTDGDLSAMIVVNDPVDPNTAGVYTVTYNVSDAAGNAAAEVTRAVTVNDPPPPPPPPPPRKKGGGGASSLLTLALLAGLAYRRRQRKPFDGKICQ